MKLEDREIWMAGVRESVRGRGARHPCRAPFTLTQGRRQRERERERRSYFAGVYAMCRYARWGT